MKQEQTQVQGVRRKKEIFLFLRLRQITFTLVFIALESASMLVFALLV